MPGLVSGSDPYKTEGIQYDLALSHRSLAASVFTTYLTVACQEAESGLMSGELYGEGELAASVRLLISKSGYGRPLSPL